MYTTILKIVTVIAVWWGLSAVRLMPATPHVKIPEPTQMVETIVELGKLEIESPKPETPFECLRKNIFFEARNQGKEGMIAVANVTMNRVHHPAYPRGVCEVVYQAKTIAGFPLRNRCHFSWYCDGKPDYVRLNNKPNKEAWKLAGEIARRALNDDIDNVVGDATHYHTNYVDPYWNDTLEQVAVVGNHIFYK